MSICRRSDDSDVYVHHALGRRLACSNCDLLELDEVVYKTPIAMLEHLNHHIERGHKVPKYAIDEIKRLGGIQAIVRFYCRCCGEQRHVIIESLQTDELNDPVIWGDIVCAHCSFVIATISAEEPGVYEIVKKEAIKTITRNWGGITWVLEEDESSKTVTLVDVR